MHKQMVINLNLFLMELICLFNKWAKEFQHAQKELLNHLCKQVATTFLILDHQHLLEGFLTCHHQLLKQEHRSQKADHRSYNLKLIKIKLFNKRLYPKKISNNNLLYNKTFQKPKEHTIRKVQTKENKKLKLKKKKK